MHETMDHIDHFDRFLITLDWLLSMHARYPEHVDFGILHICFHGHRQLGHTYGAPTAFQILNELADSLRANFRKTDLVARNGIDFWILVPYTDPQTVCRKVSKLVEIAATKGLSVVDRDVSLFKPSELMHDEVTRAKTSIEFLDHLKAIRQVAMRWEHTCDPIASDIKGSETYTFSRHFARDL